MAQPDNGKNDLTHEHVKQHLKRTQLPFRAMLEEDLEEEEEEVGTKSVIFDGEEIDLEDSDEVTAERVKDMLAKTRAKAMQQSRQARSAAAKVADSGLFKRTQRFRSE